MLFSADLKRISGLTLEVLVISWLFKALNLQKLASVVSCKVHIARTL